MGHTTSKIEDVGDKNAHYSSVTEEKKTIFRSISRVGHGEPSPEESSRSKTPHPLGEGLN